MTTITLAVVPQLSFYGNYEKEEEPTNWIRKYQFSLPLSYLDADKIMHAKLMVAQKKEHLKSVVLKEEDIGVMIEKDRGQDWHHVKWAKQVVQMALGFGDTQCHFLNVVLENTLEVLQDFLVDQYTTWVDFKADIAKTSVSQLVRAKQHIVNKQKLWEDVDKLQMPNGRKPSAPSSQITQSSFSLPPSYHYGPCFTSDPTIALQPAPLYQSALPILTTLQPPQQPPPMLPPQSPQNPFNIEVDIHRLHHEEEEPQAQIVCEWQHNMQSYPNIQTWKLEDKLMLSKFKTGACSMEQMLHQI
ncbi:hypothetical protein BDR06DRAFT_976616 [Suillus hirtellus]|nr:hypothetical protein BDR06DRAFT_976616 [Suillus hirtellus]